MRRSTLYKTIWDDFFVYFLLFVALLLFGTAGYVILEDYSFLDAIFMTTITLSTVGYSETQPLHEAGKIFSIILIIIDVGLLTYIVTKTSSFLFDGELVRLFKTASMESKIHKLNDHVIICGLGRIGTKVYTDLTSRGLQVVVIDKEHKPDLDYFIQENAIDDETLIKAGIERAKFIICALPNDAENVFIVLTAKQHNPHVLAISRASNESTIRKLRQAGANNVIMPDLVGGGHMANLILYPDVKEFIDVMSTTSSDGHLLAELIPTTVQSLLQINAWTTTGASILGIRQPSGEYIVNPSPEYVLSLDDRIIAVGRQEQLDALKKIV